MNLITCSFNKFRQRLKLLDRVPSSGLHGTVRAAELAEPRVGRRRREAEVRTPGPAALTQPGSEH